MRKLLLLVVALCVIIPNDSACASPKKVDNVDIQLTEEVTPALATKVQASVLAAMHSGAKHLTVHIDTVGGDVVSGQDIIAAIHDSGIPSTCIVYDKAFSMGLIILESSACGQRVAHAHSILMIHGVNGGSKGNQREFQNTLDRMRAMNTSIARLICARTGWDLNWYWRMFIEEARELWIVGDEALLYRLVDKVVPVPAPVALPP